MAELFGVCGVLFCGHDAERKVLLVIEKEGDKLLGKKPGMVTIPMGRKAECETPEDAIIREFGEETGLKVEIVRPIEDITQYPTTNGPIQFRAFVVRQKNEASIRGELKTRWMSVDNFLLLPNKEVRPLSQEIVCLARPAPP